jgi:hypothetical protein
VAVLVSFDFQNEREGGGELEYVALPRPYRIGSRDVNLTERVGRLLSASDKRTCSSRLPFLLVSLWSMWWETFSVHSLHPIRADFLHRIFPLACLFVDNDSPAFSDESQASFAGPAPFQKKTSGSILQ